MQAFFGITGGRCPATQRDIIPIKSRLHSAPKIRETRISRKASPCWDFSALSDFRTACGASTLGRASRHKGITGSRDCWTRFFRQGDGRRVRIIAPFVTAPRRKARQPHADPDGLSATVGHKYRHTSQWMAAMDIHDEPDDLTDDGDVVAHRARAATMLDQIAQEAQRALAAEGFDIPLFFILPTSGQSIVTFWHRSAIPPMSNGNRPAGLSRPLCKSRSGCVALDAERWCARRPTIGNCTMRLHEITNASGDYVLSGSQADEVFAEVLQVVTQEREDWMQIPPDRLTLPRCSYAVRKTRKRRIFTAPS